MSTDNKTSTRLIVASALLASGIFLIDLSVPLGVAGGVPYVALVLLSLWSPNRRFTWGMATVASALTVLGFLLSAPGGVVWMVLVNRSLALFVIWVTAILCLARKRAEEKLRLQGQIVDSMAEGISLVRPADGIIIYCNPPFERMFGYGPGELVGQHVSVVNAPGAKSPEETVNEIIASSSGDRVMDGGDSQHQEGRHAVLVSRQHHDSPTPRLRPSLGHSEGGHHGAQAG